MEEGAEVLGEIRILNDVQALILVELTALVGCEHACIVHAPKLQPLLVTNLVLRRAQFSLQFNLAHIILEGRILVQFFKHY